MATEIGRLTAIYDADTSKFETSNKKVEAGLKSTARTAERSTKDISKSLSDVGTSLSLLPGPLGRVASQVTTLTSTLGGLSLTVGAVAAPFVLLTGGAAALGAAIYTLSTRAASSVDAIGDMAEKINFSVRTLSGLKTAAEASGGSLEGLATALGIFNRNIEDAAQGEKRLSTLFKGLQVDTSNNEKAFRQVAEILVKLGGTAQQSALAMELFGRSGKDVLGIIKATGGNVEEFIKQAEKMGIVIGDDAVDAADKFDKQMVLLQAQIDAVIRQLGMELLPVVEEAVTNISNWMKENQGQIRQTVEDIGSLIRAIGHLAKVIEAVSPMVLIVRVATVIDDAVSGAVRDVTRGIAPLGGPTSGARFPGFAMPSSGGMRGPSPAAGDQPVARWSPRDLISKRSLADTVRGLLGRGGGGGGGGGRGRAARAVSEGGLGGAVSDLMEAEMKAMKALRDLTRERIVLVDTLIKAAQRTRFASDVIRQDLGGGSVYAPDATQTRQRIAGGRVGGLGAALGRAPERMEQQYQEHREQMQRLAFELTGLIDRAVYEGWKGGLMGALDIVKNIFLRQLEDALTSMLTSVTSKTGAGGGSFLGGLFSSLLGAIGFSFGGGGGGSALPMSSAYNPLGILGRASGGPVSAGKPYIVGERGPELFIPGMSGQVAANTGSTVINVNVPVRSAASYSSPRSRKQLGEDVAAALQGALG